MNTTYFKAQYRETGEVLATAHTYDGRGGFGIEGRPMVDGYDRTDPRTDKTVYVSSYKNPRYKVRNAKQNAMNGCQSK